MKKIVPFKKDISFDNNIAEISSISLEHTLKLQEENIVSGEFIISGTYKMTEASLNVDSFEYKLPFDISVDKKYDTKNIDVDINDFYYEVTNNEILSVSIEVVLDGLEEKPREEKEENTLTDEIETLEETREVENQTQTVSAENNEIEVNEETNVKSIFEDLDENERYAVYKVHIVTENDTIESISSEYNVNREDLEAYNDLSELKIGDKLIIPSHEDKWNIKK